MTPNLSRVHITFFGGSSAHPAPTSTLQSSWRVQKPLVVFRSGWATEQTSQSSAKPPSPGWRPRGQVKENKSRWQLGDHSTSRQECKNRASDRGKQKCFDGPNRLKRNHKADRSVPCCLRPRLFTVGVRFCRAVWPLWGRVQRFKPASAGHERQDGRCKQRKGHKPLRWAATLNPEQWEACQKSIFHHFILLSQGLGVQSVPHAQMFCTIVGHVQ